MVKTGGDSNTKKHVVIGNKLSFKGSKKSSKSFGNGENVGSTSGSSSGEQASFTKSEVLLTDAQKRHKQRLIDQEKRISKKVIETPYRDRVEAFNAKLASMSEHNDIPRISAAGNG